MDYLKIYRLLIENRRLERQVGYTERHHIFPRAMHPNNPNHSKDKKDLNRKKTLEIVAKSDPDTISFFCSLVNLDMDNHLNIIKLNAQEHFFAHLLLAKSFGTKETWAAVWLMLDSRAIKPEGSSWKWLRRKYEFFAHNRLNGKKHPRYDATEITFYSCKGEVFVGTKFEFREKTKLSKRSTDRMMKGHQCNGWSIQPFEQTSAYSFRMSEYFQIPSFDELRKMIISNGINTFKQYYTYRKDMVSQGLAIPSDPKSFYQNDWVDYFHFFGKIKPSKKIRKIQRKTIEDHLRDAEYLSDVEYCLPSQTELRTMGYSSLIRCMQNHPDKFIKYTQTKRITITIKEHVMRAEEIQKLQGKLPPLVWLEKNGETALAAAIREQPNLFSHLTRTRKVTSSEEHVATALSLCDSNNGILPSKSWLCDNGYADLAGYISRRPKIFADIPQSRLHAESLLEVAQSLVMEYGFLPSQGWLQKNGYKGLSNKIYQSPEQFEHMPRKG